jgi:hypothetical protein
MMMMLNKDMPGNSDIMYSVFKHLMGILSPDETLTRVKAEEAAGTAADFEDMAMTALRGQGGGGRRYKKKRRGTKKRRTKKRRTKKRRTKRRTKKR